MLCGTNNHPVIKQPEEDQDGLEEYINEEEENKNGDPLAGKRLESMKSAITHNLACINYAEIMTYLDRGDSVEDASQFDDQSLSE